MAKDWVIERSVANGTSFYCRFKNLIARRKMPLNSALAMCWTKKNLEYFTVYFVSVLGFRESFRFPASLRLCGRMGHASEQLNKQWDEGGSKSLAYVYSYVRMWFMGEVQSSLRKRKLWVSTAVQKNVEKWAKLEWKTPRNAFSSCKQHMLGR